MERVHIGIVGIMAGLCTTISFIPQIVKIWKTKNVRDISLYMYIILTTGICLWLIYGLLIREFPIIFANVIGAILCSYILVMKVRYRNHV